MKVNVADATNPLSDALNNLTKEDPSVIGANLKPRMFVIKSCPGCNCKPMETIRSKSANVVTIDPLSSGAQSDFSAQLTKKEMDTACVVRPPIWHTCGAEPNQVKSTKYDDFKGSLKYLDPVTGIEHTVKDLNELVAKIGTSGTCQSALSPQARIDSVSCSASASTRLPSEDEMADCQTEIKKRAPTTSVSK